MKVTYLDLETGRIAQEEHVGPYSLTDGNWSCDCSRRIPFGYKNQNKGVCDGCVRFIVIDVEPEEDGDFPNTNYSKEDILKDANREYYIILKAYRDK